MSVFVGIGAGPIQTGIFVAGAAAAGYKTIAMVDVDASLVAAIRRSGSVTVNTAQHNAITSKNYHGIVALHPERDRDTLLDIVAQATSLATALPTTRLYTTVAPWLREAFRRDPERRRYIYTAENSTTAARELADLLGRNEFPNTFALDTVIGKMSQVVDAETLGIAPLAKGESRGHLVEAFHTIYTSIAPGLDEAILPGLTIKRDLRPFEEAKLYGHNATHLLLGVWAAESDCRVMSEVAAFPDRIALAEEALLDECGRALCRRFAGVDPFFEPDLFAVWGRGLVARMVSPTLHDSVERVLRDLERKLGWDDRLLGAIRLCRAEGVEPTRLLNAARRAMRRLSPATFENIVRSWGDSDDARNIAGAMAAGNGEIGTPISE